MIQPSDIFAAAEAALNIQLGQGVNLDVNLDIYTFDHV